MKKSFIAAFLLVSSWSTINAQSGKVISAWKYLSDYTDSKDSSSLFKAKEAIDIAINNTETNQEAKTWFYKGKIYQSFFDYNLQSEINKQKTESNLNKKTAVAYLNVGIDAIDQASKAYMKTKELDVKKKFEQEALQRLAECGRHFENIGISAYNSQQYFNALNSFEKAVETNAFIGQTDTNNINNSALVANKSKNYEKAKTYYQKLIDLKYGSGNMYMVLTSVYENMNDSVGAEAIIKKARVAFPNDVNIMIAEINYAIKNKKSDEAIANLKQAIQKQPNDYNLHLVLGNLCDNMANPKDATGKDLAKPANYDDYFKQSEESYKKAIELKPQSFDANYNLGVLYYNNAVSLSNKANSGKITDAAKYNAENAKADECFAKGLPYLEKALELNTTDRSTMIALKQLYARTKQTEKLNKINELLKN